MDRKTKAAIRNIIEANIDKNKFVVARFNDREIFILEKKLSRGGRKIVEKIKFEKCS